MDICVEGIGQMVATFATEEELEPGMAVTMTGSGEVGLSKEVENGDGPLCGVTAGASRNGAVAVQIGGVVKVGCSDDADLKVGWQKLICDGEGGVTTDGADDVSYLVLAVDEDEKTVVVKL